MVKVTNIAEAIVTKYGMSSILGPIVYDQSAQNYLQSPLNEKNYRIQSQETFKNIDHEIKKFVDEASQKAFSILTQYKSVLENGAKILIEKETLTEDDLKELFKTIIPL